MIIIVMGVTGAGKTTVGSLLARSLGWEFADADDFHSPANVEKMSNGMVLDDDDRGPWLAAMRSAILGWLRKDVNAVLACSALKQNYRDQLAVGPEVRFVFLKGTYDQIRGRVAARHGHFATEKILSNQFETLEEPRDAVTVEVEQDPEAIVAEIRRQLAI